MEKFFSVVIETESGEKRTLTIQGENTSGVFQRVKAMPGVRRVGRVSESGAAEASDRPVAAPQAEDREQKSTEPRATIHYSNTGPRVVTYGRPVSGEQPFKYLTPPPPRPVAPPPAYRVMKSRRTGGDPYLLQRGHWQEKDGKRLFTTEWEKGFPDREKALSHQKWIEQTAAEVADADDQV